RGGRKGSTATWSQSIEKGSRIQEPGVSAMFAPLRRRRSLRSARLAGTVRRVSLQLEALEDRTLPAVAALPGVAVGVTPFAVVSADVNGDGRGDLITANAISNDLSVLLGNGDGSFGEAQSFATGGTPFAVVVADLNGDGSADIATANASTNDVSVLLGNGDGSFQGA